MRWWNEKEMLWLQHRPTHVWFTKKTVQVAEQGPLKCVSVGILINNFNQTTHKKNRMLEKKSLEKCVCI